MYAIRSYYEKHLRGALVALERAEGVTVLRRSRWHETAHKRCRTRQPRPVDEDSETQQAEYDRRSYNFV